MAGILECWCVISSHHVAFVLFSHSLWSKCLAVVNVGWSIILEGPRSIGQKSAGWDIQNRASEFRFPCCGRPQCIPQSVFLLCRDSSSLWYSLIYNSFRDSLQQTPKTLKQKHIEIIEWRALTWSAMKCHEVPWSAHGHSAGWGLRSSHYASKWNSRTRWAAWGQRVGLRLDQTTSGRPSIQNTKTLK